MPPSTPIAGTLVPAHPGRPSDGHDPGEVGTGDPHLLGDLPGPGGNDSTWERLSGVSGTPEDIIATDQPPGQAVVEIDPSDIAFNSFGCVEGTELEVSPLGAADRCFSTCRATNTGRAEAPPSPSTSVGPQSVSPTAMASTALAYRELSPG